MKNTFKKIMSLILVFTMLIGFIPTSNVSMASNENVLDPITKNGLTTFSYQGDDDTRIVKLPGSFNGWNVDDVELEKGDDNIFTTQLKLEPGKYEYKYHVNGEWMEGDNLVVVVEGLKITSKSLINAGSSIDLQAVYVDEAGNETNVEADFSIENPKEGIAIEGNKLIVSNEIIEKSVEIVAKFDDYEARQNVEIASGLNKYIVNYKREDSTHMDWDMWVWGNGIDGSAYSFTSEEDGYAKGVIELPISEISIITRPKSWDSQEVERKVIMPEGQNEVEVWMIQGDDTVYFEKPTSKPALRRNILFNYDRLDKDYTGWDLWVWFSGLSDGSNRFDENGQVRFNIADDSTNVGFKIHRIEGEDQWKEIDQDYDRLIPTDPEALEKTTKIYAKQGEGEFRQVPYLYGPKIEGDSIIFYYRDLELYENLEFDKLEKVSINLSKRNLVDGNITELGTFDMSLNKENEYFEYKLENAQKEYDYIYSFNPTVEGKTSENILDIYNTINEESYIRFRDTNLKVSVNSSSKPVEAGDSVVIGVEVDNPDNEEIKEIYIDGNSLGLENIEVSKELMKQSIAIPYDQKAGKIKLDVVVVDSFDGRHIGSHDLEILENSDSEDTIDWDEEIIYFMLTDRFSDGDKLNNEIYGEGLDKNHLEAYHGGDFQGIIDNVEYLKELGITTVWITPIVDNIDDNLRQSLNDKQYGYHGYWTKDFTNVEPGLGDIEKLKELIDVLHENGIKLMIDVVLNHPGYNTQNEEVFSGMIREKAGSNDLTMELSGLPDFKTENEDVSEKLVKWQSEWLENLVTDKGNTVDYYRVDTVKHVEHDTWKEFKNALVEIKPDFKLIGEYYGANVDTNGGYLGNGMMDSVLDFEFKSLAERFVKGDIKSVEDRLVYRNEKLNPNETLGQFLSSHDEDGFLKARLNDDKNLQKVASSLQLTAKGQPIIYYGEEIGMSGLNANFDIGRYGENRQSFKWEDVENNDLLEHYQKMINIRKDNQEIFSKGDRKTLFTNDKVSIFERTYNGKSIIVGLNISNEEQSVAFEFDKSIGNKLEDIYGTKSYEAISGKADITIPASSNGGTVVLIPEKDPNIVDESVSKVIVHFDNPNNDPWSIWLWPENGDGAQYEFTDNDDFGQVATIELDDVYDRVGIIIKGKDDWSKNVDGDRFIDLTGS